MANATEVVASTGATTTGATSQSNSDKRKRVYDETNTETLQRTSRRLQGNKKYVSSFFVSLFGLRQITLRFYLGPF